MSNTHEGELIGDFRVRLPAPLRFSGRYECALTEIIYPHTFDNLSEREEDAEYRENTVYIEYLNHKGELRSSRLEIPSGNYPHAEKLVNTLNQRLRDALQRDAGVLLSDLPLISFDHVTNKCWLNVLLPAVAVSFSKKLAYVLGVDRHVRLKESFSGRHPVHTAKELIFVYADCCEFQILSNVMCPLLRVIAASGEFGTNVEHSIVRPHYIPVRSNDIDSIRIQLKNDQNETIPFHSGKVCIVLHFRKASFID